MDDLFAELKPQIEALAAPLFGASQMAVRKRSRFLPHGALLDAGGEVRLVMATLDDLDAPASPAEVLPRLHDALRAASRDHAAAAVAVCEDVTITPAGGKSTKAVKVLVEHRRGLTVALYLPWRRSMLGTHVFGEVMALAATPEVQVWGES